MHENEISELEDKIKYLEKQKCKILDSHCKKSKEFDYFENRNKLLEEALIKS